jgi:hypothetical protein
MIDLVPLFDTLEFGDDSSGTVRFTAHPLAGYEGYRVAKDVDGAPAILVSVSRLGAERANPIAIEHLIVQHDVECRIADSSEKLEVGRFSLIRCRGQERSLHVYFLRVVGALIATLGPDPSQDAVAVGVNKLVELFRAMSEPSRKSIQGLWAELFVIAQSKSPIVLVQAWHAALNDVYDFSRGEQHIEVKSSLEQIRQHYFSMEQLNPPTGTQVLVVSICVSRATMGEALTDLVDKIRRRMPNDFDLLLRIESIVAYTLGDNWRAAVEDQFDWELATKTVAYFDAAQIPGIRSELPTGVSGVSFISDLSNTRRADLSTFRSTGSLFQALMR